MKKKFIAIYIFMCIAILSGYNTIYALDVDPNDGAGGSGSYNNTCKTKDSSWSSSYQGYRLTYVLKSTLAAIPGSHSIDVWNSDVLTSKKPFVSTTLRSKTQAIKTTSGVFAQGNYVKNSNYFYFSNLPISMGYKKKTVATIRNYIIKKYISSDGTRNTLRSISATFGLPDGVFDSYIENGTEFYLMVEPLALIYLDKDFDKSATFKYKYIAGTSTELAHLIDDWSLWCVGSILKKGELANALYVTKDWKIPIEAVSGDYDNATDRSKFLSGDPKHISGYGVALYDPADIIENICTTPGHVWKSATECCSNANNMAASDLNSFYAAHPACKPPTTGCGDGMCDFSLDLSVPNNCESSTTGSIKDTDNWCCIFDSKNSTDSAIANHYYEWSNTYCSVFCREEVTYNYPGSGTTVLAGKNFTVGASGYFPTVSPVVFSSKTECKPTSSNGKINYDKFTVDYEAANKAVANAWDEYQIAIIKNSILSNPISSTPYSSCCSHDAPPPFGTGACTSTGHGNMYTYGTGSYTRYTGTVESITFGSCGTACGSCASSYNTSSYLSAYNSAVAYRDNLTVLLNSCNNYQYTNDDFNPSVYFKYEEAIYGDTNYKLVGGMPDYTSVTSYYKDNSTKAVRNWDTGNYSDSSNDFVYSSGLSGSSASIMKYVCSGNSACTQSSTSYQNNDTVTQVTNKTYDYTLPANVYQYVGRPSGQSYNTSAQALTGDKTYYYIPYSNLPVHYSREAGDYTFEINFNTFGIGHKFDDYIFGGAKIGKSYGEDLSIYSLLWNNSSLNGMIADCQQGGHHLDHDFVSAIGSRLGEFLNSGCANTYSCATDSGGAKVICNRYYDALGNAQVASSTSQYNTVYSQLKSCIQGKVVNTTGSIAFTGNTKYECTYSVENEIFCNPGEADCPYVGLSIVYRTIALDNPFPGIEGTGRNPGGNWFADSSVTDYITNSRGVDQSRLYIDTDPLYKIVLTPALIKQIRDYNEAQELKPDTYYDGTGGAVDGLSGYSDFEMKCDGDGKNCKSDFIRSIVKIDSKTVDFSKYFTGCALLGKNSNLKCASGEAW